ncbi:MAG: family 78 glycoside hydrolase catalytic domain [Clostridia bacterium]|nr:family 78 glycoside hydrolase catalytic domain [Clostridia bacterium]
MLEFGKWIWTDNEDMADSYAEFYRSFYADGACRVALSCDGDYTLFINGQYVSSNQYGDFEHYKIYDEIDITSYIRKGENHLAVLVWHFGCDSQRYKRYSPGLFLELWQGETLIFASDERFLSRKSRAYTSGKKRLISSQLGFGYEYDSTRKDDWTVGLGSGMTPSVAVEKSCTLFPRPNNKLRLGNAVYGKEIHRQGRKRVYDLGKEYVGLLTLELTSPESERINIAYGEHLVSLSVRRKMWDRDFSVDYITCRGENRHTGYMLRLACRYIELDCHEGTDVSLIGIIPQYYPVKVGKEPEINGLDREIYQLCVNTLKLCMMEHYVDCPWREQCLYAFDSRNQMLAGYYAFENKNREYARSNLILMSKDRRQDGLMSICYPCGVDLTIPSFSLHYIASVKEYMEITQDVSIIAQVGDKLREILSTFLGNRKNGLVYTFGGENHWSFYDWSNHLDGSLGQDAGEEGDAMINLLTIQALINYEKICSLSGIAFEYGEELAQLKVRVKEEFFDTGRGVFLFKAGIKPLSLVNSLAVLVGLTDGDEAERICRMLASGELSPSSLSTRCFMYDALIKTDRDKYRDFIIEDIRKTYAPMLETGTAWETVIGCEDFDGAGSLCHGWSCMPIYYYHILKG